MKADCSLVIETSNEQAARLRNFAFRAARRWVKTQADADDLTQEVLAKWFALPGETRFKLQKTDERNAYIRTMIRNAFLDRTRGSREEPADELPEPPTPPRQEGALVLKDFLGLERAWELLHRLGEVSTTCSSQAPATTDADPKRAMTAAERQRLSRLRRELRTLLDGKCTLDGPETDKTAA